MRRGALAPTISLRLASPLRCIECGEVYPTLKNRFSEKLQNIHIPTFLITLLGQQALHIMNEGGKVVGHSPLG
jgi:hypothetical protein